MFVDHRTAFRKAYLVNLLARLCAELDISEARRRQAQERYEGVAEWLAGGDHFLLGELSIYLQGSTALGTSVKPIGRNEHDVDLVAFMPAGWAGLSPAFVKAVIGDRLKANEIYSRLLEEKCRCWRLVYANLFHLDITPSILNPVCASGGELVPDRSLSEWKGSNPKGYRRAFERRAALVPRLRITRAMDEAKARADIEPFPATASGRSLLCIIVQVAKRHRDVHFEGPDAALAPISVILTTLMAWSYEACVASAVYDTEFDLLLDVLRRMPSFIRHTLPDGSPGWHIPNETTTGDENFAERWNNDPRLARAFFAWHAKALADMAGLAAVEGVDLVRKRMDDAFGPRPVARAFTSMDEDVASARASGLLRVAPAVGILAAPAAASAVPVRPNTFFGRD